MDKSKAEAIVNRLITYATGMRYGSVSVVVKYHDGRVVSLFYSTTMHTLEPKIEKDKINEKTHYKVKAVVKTDKPETEIKAEIKNDFGTPDVLSRREAAAFLRICLATLDQLDVPRTKIGHRVMYKREVLSKWIDEHTEKRKKQ
jgi:hypothetical protein